MKKYGVFFIFLVLFLSYRSGHPETTTNDNILPVSNTSTVTNSLTDFTNSNSASGVSNGSNIFVTNEALNSTSRIWTNTVKITNFTIENGFTNYKESFTDIIIMLYDPFTPLAGLESPDELQEAVSELIFPDNDLLLNRVEPKSVVRRKYNNGLKLLTTESLIEYSKKAFQNYSIRKQTGQLNFTDDEKQHLNIGFEQWETKIIVSGGIDLRTSFGVTAKDESFQQSLPGIFQGFNINQNMHVNILGKIGDRIQVSINHSSDNPDNIYEIGYKALDSDSGILKELKAGNISLNIPQSSYFVKYNGTSKDSYGLISVFQIGDFNWQTVLNLVTSQKGYKKFVGNRKLNQLEIPDVNYVKRKYFVLPDQGIDGSSVELLASTSISNIANRQIDSRYFIRLIQGKDYFINLSTGALTLTNSLDRNIDLVIKYTKKGFPFTTGPNGVTGTDNNTGEKFLYLWQSTKNFSPFVNYGTYNLGYQNFDPTRGFSLSVVYTSDQSRQAENQFAPSDYDASPIDGTIKFNNPQPFPDPNGKLYTNAADPLASDSIYTMIVKMFNDVSSYQLDFGVIPGTERVFVNGKPISQDAYTLISSVGELIFHDSALINENDTIEIFYEYKPFFSGSQKVGIATRLDWKPSNLFNVGSTLIYNLSQREPGAPSIYSTPDGVFMADVDGNINLARLFRLPDDFEATVKGEFALSVIDPNTAGYAIIDDFENSGNTISFTKNESRWILCAPTAGIDGVTYTNRGQMLYKDYRAYNLDGSYSLLHYSSILTPDKIKDYSYKPGPYTVLGGHLDPSIYPNVSQASLAFDYNFGPDGNWVGAAFSLGGQSGVDLSTYNEISLWVKVQGDENADSVFEDKGDQSVELAIGVGQINEDADGNGLLDAEIDRSQAGYDFHNYTNTSLVETHVGRGRLGQGDGFIQSEDLNGNGVLDTNDSMVVFPSANGYTDIDKVIVNEGAWQKITINIRSLSSGQINVLQHASSLALYLKKANGTRGRVLIDTLDFNQVNWKEKVIDGVNIDTAPAFQGESISVFNDSYYMNHKFYNPQSSDSNDSARTVLFEKLHGPKTISDASQFNEKALSLVYNFSNVTISTNSNSVAGGMSGYLIKRNTTSFDISRYKFLSFYIFVPDTDENNIPLKQNGDTFTNESFGFILGNSDNTFYKWLIPLDQVLKNSWHKVTVNITDNMAIDVDGTRITGHEAPVFSGIPNARDINFFEIGVETTSTNEPVNNGIVWVNEMYVSSDNALVGTAFYVNPIFQYKKPVLSIGGFDILGPVTLQSTVISKDLNFVPSEGVVGGTYDNDYNINFSSSILKGLLYSISYDNDHQGTESNTTILPLYLQWDYQKRTFNDTIQYNSPAFVPSITHSFTETFETRLSRNLISTNIDDSLMDILDSQYNSSAKIDIVQNLPFFRYFSLSPRISFEDSYFLQDHSNYTNEMNNYFITNSTVFGMKNLKKTLLAGLNTSIWLFNITGDYSKAIERFSVIDNPDGYRLEVNNLNSMNVLQRYQERLGSFIEGFYFPDESQDKQNLDLYNINFNYSGDRQFSFVNLSINDKLSRQASTFGYDNNGNLVNKAESFGVFNESHMTIYPKWIIDSVQFRLQRNMNLSYNSVVSNIDITNIINNLGELYYYPPFYYSGLFLGNWGRTNSLHIVDQFSAGDYNSQSQFNDIAGIDIVLMDMNNILDTFIPKRFSFTTTLLTARNINSYSQNLDNLLTTSFPLKLTGWGIPFIRSDGDIRIGDLIIDLSYENKDDYNSRLVNDIVTGNIRETVFISTNADISVSYGLSFNSSRYLTNVETFEQSYNMVNPGTALSPSQIYSHNGTLMVDWVLNIKDDLDLILFKLETHNTTFRNKEVLNITGDSINYSGNNFTRFTQKIIECTLDHSTDYKFSDFVTGTLLLKGVVNEYADVTPVGSDIHYSYFKPGLGFQVGANVSINF